MGSTTANGFADMARSTGNLDNAILANLQSNHYPPIPGEYLEPVKRAIEAAKAHYGLAADTLIGLESVRSTGMIPRDAYEDEDLGLVIPASILLTITHSWEFVDDDVDFNDEEDNQ